MIIVTGLARSGLTATMQMLNAGGYPCLGEYPAFEKYDVGKTPWRECDGKTVKLVDAQLHFPPEDINTKVIILSRNLKQQAKSFNKFIGYLNNLPPSKKYLLIKSFKKDMIIIRTFFKKYKPLSITFENIIKQPENTARTISQFIDFPLDIKKAAGIIINRKTTCGPKFYELDMINRGALIETK